MKSRILNLSILVWLVPPAQAQIAPDLLWEKALNYSYVITDVAVSSDGAYAASPHDGGTDIRRVSDGANVTNLAMGGTWVSDLTFSPDCRYVAGAGSGGTVRVWNVADWSLAYSALASGPLVFSPDSSMLATVQGSVIELRNATNGILQHSWTNSTTTFGVVVALAFSPDGTMLASGAGGRGSDTNLTIWSVPVGEFLFTFPTAQTYHVGSIDFSPNGQWVATSGGRYAYGPAQLWRVSDWHLVRTFPGDAYAACFSPDGAMLAVVGSDIDFYSVSSGALLQHYSDSGHGSHYQKALAFTPNGSTFLRVCYAEILAARVPLAIHEFTRKHLNWEISWTGGCAPCQLQECANTLPGTWENVGLPTTNRTMEIEPRTAGALYRVIALPE